jgi:ATP-dependent helicase/nuclease subunit B
MAEPRGPAIYTIPASRTFADALVDGILAQHGHDPMALARGMVVLPNNRARKAINDAFVRRAEPALLLPRLVVLGDAELGEEAGLAFDTEVAELPPAIEPLQRQLILARLIQRHRLAEGRSTDAAMAMTLASDLANAMDALTIEEKSLADVRDALQQESLTEHWQKATRLFSVLQDEYPRELARLNRIDVTDRRNRLLHATAEHWRRSSPAGFVLAAGISTPAPAIAALLGVIARMARGSVVLAALDLDMAEAEWDAIRGAGEQRRQDAHPQYHLSRLLNGMGISRNEVRLWPGGVREPARDRASIAANRALAPAEFTREWSGIPATQRSLSHVSEVVFPTLADEAQGIAIALRGVLETPGKTAALITPDRSLAARVAAHLARWDISADDSAGKPLSLTVPGGLVQAIVAAVSSHFAPSELLALLKHPLIRKGDEAERRAWLDGARWLDLALRGPRPAPGLAGVTAWLKGGQERERKTRDRALARWSDVALLLEPIEAATTAPGLTLANAVRIVRDAATLLAGEEAWRGHEGRAVSDLFDRLGAVAAGEPLAVELETLPQLFRTLLDGSSVRPPYGGHHRIAIWGLLEARLQSADLVILGGLNEGSWPQMPSPDPWLAPVVRAALDLPGLDFRIGLSAHDFVLALGGKEVIVSRSQRDATAPAVASRFLLRLRALTGGLAASSLQMAGLARAMDGLTGSAQRTSQPKPCPPVADRPTAVNVTDVDRLKADPFAFYAQKMLKLSKLDRVDADPGAAWRGSFIHDLIEQWAKLDRYAAGGLLARLAVEQVRADLDPVLRTLWMPRMVAAAQWLEDQIASQLAEGRVAVLQEEKGSFEFGDIKVTGKPDRIDRLADGTFAVVDYKSGQPPSNKQISEGFALQLGLLGALVEAGAFPAAHGAISSSEYWRMNKKGDQFGSLHRVNLKDEPRPLPELALEHFELAVETWLTGDEPFTAKLHPLLAPFEDYDQLMRLEEWYGRQSA